MQFQACIVFQKTYLLHDHVHVLYGIYHVHQYIFWILLEKNISSETSKLNLQRHMSNDIIYIGCLLNPLVTEGKGWLSHCILQIYFYQFLTKDLHFTKGEVISGSQLYNHISAIHFATTAKVPCLSSAHSSTICTADAVIS